VIVITRDPRIPVNINGNVEWLYQEGIAHTIDRSDRESSIRITTRELCHIPVTTAGDPDIAIAIRNDSLGT